MDIVKSNVTVRMVRPNLLRVPDFALPEGYEICHYALGDERDWIAVQAASDAYNTITLELYRRTFGTDAGVLAERQFFLRDAAGQAVGTATAWFDDAYRGQRYGQVHWVAIRPEWQGRGLAKPLLGAVCRRLIDLDHERAYLVTSTARLPAINLYFRFGFVPEMTGDETRRVWEQMRPYLPEAGAFFT